MLTAQHSNAYLSTRTLITKTSREELAPAHASGTAGRNTHRYQPREYDDDDDDDEPDTPLRRDAPVVYASSAQRHTLSASRPPSRSIANGAQTPFQRAASISSARKKGATDSRNQPPVSPFPGNTSEDNDSEMSFVDGEFKKLVEELGNEELTRLDGFSADRGKHFGEIGQHMDDSDEKEPEPVRAHERPMRRREDTPYHVDHIKEAGYTDDEETRDNHFLNEPTMELLDAEFEQLNQSGAVGSAHEHDISKMDGFSELEMTGFHDVQEIGDASPGSHAGHISPATARHVDSPEDSDRANMQEFWDHAASMATPTPASFSRGMPRRASSQASGTENVRNEQGASADIQPFETRLRQVETGSPESSLGVLSECASDLGDEMPSTPNAAHYSQKSTVIPREDDEDDRHSDAHLRTFPSPYGAQIDQNSRLLLSPREGMDRSLDGSSPPRSSPERTYDGPPSHGVNGTKYNPMHEALAEARDECRSLRALNERLLQSNEEVRADLEAALHEKLVTVTEMASEYERKLRAKQEEDTEKYRQLHHKLALAEQQLEQAQNAQDQMSSIRSSLQQEKELDILNIKKELAAQKERELHDLRRAMAADKDEISRKVKEDLKRQEQSFAEERERLEHEVNRLRKMIRQRDEDMCQLEEQLYVKSRRPLSEDFGQQFDAYAEEHQNLQREMSELKNGYESQVAALRRELNEERENSKKLQQKVAAQEPMADLSLNELLAKYPNQLDQYRSTLSAGYSERLAARESAHASALRDMHARHESTVKELVSCAEQEKKFYLEKQRQEIVDITARLKEQCAKAYDVAIQRLRADFVRSEKNLAEQFKKQKEAWLAGMKQKQLDQGRPAAREGGRSEEALRNRIAELETTVRSLKDALAQSALDHNQALLDANGRSTRELQESLQKMKVKYLETLKTMRDDLKRSKQLGLDKLEIEWNRRKEQLDQEWQKRLEEVKQRYRGSQPRPRATQVSPPVRRPLSSDSKRAGDVVVKAAWKPPGPGASGTATSSTAAVAANPARSTGKRY